MTDKVSTNFLLMKRFFLIIFYLSSATVMHAQQSGIKWTEGMNWEQVKQKAKHESKFIFLDVFATWCGPCKLMDKEVYPNDTLGKYFNEHFISVRVQSDRTEKDNVQVTTWYNDAEEIIKKYRVEGFPSFVFLNPEGERVEMQTGYKSATDLMAIAKTAITPGKTYDDPYAEYELLLSEYKKGKRNMTRMPYLIGVALSYDTAIFLQALKEYTDYCMTVKPTDRYTRENIQMWSAWTLKSTTRAFKFFYKDGDIIDGVMNKKGFAASIVDRTIYNEIIDTFFKEQTSNSGKMSQGAVLTDLREKPDYREADWKKLHTLIRRKFNKSYADRNVLEARLLWYQRHKNYSSYVKWQLYKFKKNPPDITAPEVLGVINSFGWNAFLQITDKALLESVTILVAQAVNQSPDGINLLDTYANLLYKLERTKEAIEYEEKAVIAAEKSKYASHKRKIPGMKAVIEKMKKGEPTYVEQGAIWTNK